MFITCQEIMKNGNHCVPEPKGGLFKLLVLSGQQSKSQRYSINNYLKTEKDSKMSHWSLEFQLKTISKFLQVNQTNQLIG